MTTVWRAYLTRIGRPRWLGAAAAALAFFALCLFLGQWQFGRHQERAASAERIERHYAAAPVALEEVLPPGAGEFPQDSEWTRVRVTGSYAQDGQLMARNRPQNVVYGYEVLVPLRLADGSAILVDRGWVPNAGRADILPQVPPAPAGQVTVTGWLRPGEPALGDQLPPGHLASISLTQASQLTGLRLRPAYVVLDAEDDGSGTAPARPQRLLPPDTGTGSHLAYSLQWWGASVTGFVIVAVYLRREVRDDLASSSGAGGAARPARVRIWDEEDA